MTGYIDMSDEQLMAQVCHGNHDAFAQLVHQHTQQFFALAFRTLQDHAEAEDIVQTAFIKLWQRPAAWNQQKSKFTTWFYRVILNACHDHLRKQKHWQSADIGTLDAALEPVCSEQVNLEQAQLTSLRQQSLELAIKGLPASQRDALNLVVYCSLPQAQAASILGVSLKALESLLVRAKRSLKKQVAAMQNDSEAFASPETKESPVSEASVLKSC